MNGNTAFIATLVLLDAALAIGVAIDVVRYSWPLPTSSESQQTVLVDGFGGHVNGPFTHQELAMLKRAASGDTGQALLSLDIAWSRTSTAPSNGVDVSDAAPAADDNARHQAVPAQIWHDASHDQADRQDDALFLSQETRLALWLGVPVMMCALVGLHRGRRPALAAPWTSCEAPVSSEQAARIPPVLESSTAAPSR